MSKPAKKPQSAAPLSPKQYALSGMARKLPIVECWLNPGWREEGLATVLVGRQHKNGNYTLGTYLIDVYCLGLKQTTMQVNMPDFTYREHIERFMTNQPLAPAEYVLVHNIVYGAIAYAEDLGIKPADKDWAITQYILEDDTDDVPLLDLEFGKEGKPFYITGPYDKPMEIMAKLDKAVGQGNYGFMFGGGGF
jgi:hypothetical protein